jgi:hypothetical protein
MFKPLCLSMYQRERVCVRESVKILLPGIECFFTCICPCKRLSRFVVVVSWSRLTRMSPGAHSANKCQELNKLFARSIISARAY